MGDPGGKVDKSETPLQAAIREIYEETGYQISLQEIDHLKTVYLKTVYIEYDERDRFVYHMFRTILNGDPGAVKINFNEHKGFTWVTPSESLTLDLLKGEDPCIRLIYPV